MLKLSFSLATLGNCTSGCIVRNQDTSPTIWYAYHQKKYRDMMQFQWIISPLILSCKYIESIFTWSGLQQKLAGILQNLQEVIYDQWWLILAYTSTRSDLISFL